MSFIVTAFQAPKFPHPCNIAQLKKLRLITAHRAEGSLFSATEFSRTIIMKIPTISGLSKLVFIFLLVFFYPSLRNIGSASNGSTKKEKTLAMVKPDGFSGNYTDKVKNAIVESGFTICKEITIQLDEDRVTSFYSEHSSKSFFHSLVKYMTSGPVLVMILEKENAVADWRALIGPTDASKAKITHPHSIRAMCGLDSQNNCVHGSDSSQSAQREISFFFEDKSAALFGGSGFIFYLDNSGFTKMLVFEFDDMAHKDL